MLTNEHIDRAAEERRSNRATANDRLSQESCLVLAFLDFLGTSWAFQEGLRP